MILKGDCGKKKKTFCNLTNICLENLLERKERMDGMMLEGKVNKVERKLSA